MRWLIRANPFVRVGVDQFIGTARRLGQDAEPGEGVFVEVPLAVRFRDLEAAVAAGAVSTHQEVRLDLELHTLGIGEPDLRFALEIVDGGVSDAVADVAVVVLPAGGEVQEDVRLRVKPYRLPHQVLEIDAVALAVEPQLNAVVPVAVAQHPVRDAAVHEQVHRAVLQDAGPDGVGDFLVAADLDHRGLDSGRGQQVGEHEACRSAAHDGYLRGDDFSCHDCISLRCGAREGPEWLPGIQCGPAGVTGVTAIPFNRI